MTNGAPNTPHLNLRAIVSVVETVAYALALMFAAVKGGHLNPATIISLLSGFTAHGVNHPAGGSPV